MQEGDKTYQINTFLAEGVSLTKIAKALNMTVYGVMHYSTYPEYKWHIEWWQMQTLKRGRGRAKEDELEKLDKVVPIKKCYEEIKDKVYKSKEYISPKWLNRTKKA